MSYVAKLRVFAVKPPKVVHSAQYGKVPEQPERDPKVLNLRIEASTVQELAEKLSVVVDLIDDVTNTNK